MSKPGAFKCKACGKLHEFPPYVYTYWRDKLQHLCECGAKHIIQGGRATQTK